MEAQNILIEPVVTEKTNLLREEKAAKYAFKVLPEANKFQIIRKVLLPEAKPSLIIGAAISIVTILSYSAMAATLGGTGLGQIAIIYGHQRSNPDITWICVFLTVIIVQIIQVIGTTIAHKTDKRIRNQ